MGSAVPIPPFFWAFSLYVHKWISGKVSKHAFDERLRLSALVLTIAAKEAEGIRRTQLEKQTVLKHPRQCATHGKFEGCFEFLTRNGYLVRVRRGVYKISPDGVKFMESTPK